MHTSKRVCVHRFGAASPDDFSELETMIKRGLINPRGIVAVLGKTEGNGCVNDFTRGFASSTLKTLLSAWADRSAEEISKTVAMVMSGGTEGGLSPHWLVFEVVDAPQPRATQDGLALAIGVEITREFLPEEVGRMAQILATAAAVKAAMYRAGISNVEDVHYVQIKCPLLTKQRIAAALGRGHTVATEDTYLSMGYSRGASALGVALALGEVQLRDVSDEVVCTAPELFSSRASTSAGIEMMENQVMVLGNSAAWTGDLSVSHSVMKDAIDTDAVIEALDMLGLRSGMRLEPSSRSRIAAVLAKAEPSRSGNIRGRRHVMLDDSDIHASRHARALVGGVLAGIFGDTQLFVSGGAEHQGPDGGGPIAIIASRDAS